MTDIIPTKHEVFSVNTEGTSKRRKITVPQPTSDQNPNRRKRRIIGSPAQKNKRPYIIDYQTQNISFLQTSVDLENLGIKNNKFMLALYDSGLQGVDPHDPKITEDLARRVIIECTVNPMYFIREVVRLPSQGGMSIPYIMHRANLAATFLFLKNIDHYLVIPRQKGKTMGALVYLLWAYIFGTSRSEFMFSNKKLEEANANLQRLKDLRDFLPVYMQSKEIIDDEGKVVKGRDNVKSITNPVNGNSIVTKPSATSVTSAEGIGRGSSQPIQYFDEVEFSAFIDVIVQASGPAYVKAAEHARRNGAPHCRIYTSTPGDLDTKAGEAAQRILDGTCEWDEKMYDMTDKELQEYINIHARDSGIVYIEYNYRQLGEGDAWLNEISRVLLYDKMKIRREVHLKRMHGSSQSPFDPEDITALNDMMRDPIDTIFFDSKYKLDIYKKLKREKIYVMGVDTSKGIGRDNNAITITDPDTEEPVAEFKSPWIGPVDFANLIQDIVLKLIPRAIVAIETNVGGYVMIDYLSRGPISRNIFYEKSTDITKTVDKRVDDKGFLRKDAYNRRHQGVTTTGKSRELMMLTLENVMATKMENLTTRNITKEIGTLILTKSGKIEHGPDSKDDSVMSYLISLYVIRYSKNLRAFGYIPGVSNVEKTLEEIEKENYENFMASLDPEERAMYTQYIDVNEDMEREQMEMERIRAQMEMEERQMGIHSQVDNHLSQSSHHSVDIDLSIFDDDYF